MIDFFFLHTLSFSTLIQYLQGLVLSSVVILYISPWVFLSETLGLYNLCSHGDRGCHGPVQSGG